MKSNPDLLAVTDPTEDDEIEQMLTKIKNETSKEDVQKYQPVLTTDPLVLAALEEDLAALEKHGNVDFMTPTKDNAEEVPENTYKEEKKNEIETQAPGPKIENKELLLNQITEKKSEDDEPSEGSFNEYSLQNEMNMMTKDLETSINKRLDEEEKKENDEKELKQAIEDNIN